MKYWTIILLGSVLLWACEPEEEEDWGEGEPLADVSGVWTLTGGGALSNCRDANFNADSFTLSGVTLRVTQADDASLSAEVPDQDEFVFSGQVVGARVDFETRETTPHGKVVLQFTGRANTIGNLQGEFTGDGPSTCEGEGSFVVEIRNR